MLVIEFETRRGRRSVEIPPAPALLLVGSGADCDLVIRDDAVDAEHLELARTPAGVRLTDLRTRRGTRLNGELVGQAVLKPGDEIGVGRKTLVLRRVGEPARKPAPAAPARPERTRPRQRRRRSPTPLIVGAVVVAALGGVWFLSTGESRRRDEARTRYEVAREAWEAGETERAERLFREVTETWPDTPAATEAAADLEGIAEEREREEEARLAKAELRKRWTSVRFEELEKDWREFRSEYEGTTAAADEDFLEELRREYDRERKRRFEAVKGRAERLLDQGRYYDAILAWHEYITLAENLSNIPPDISAATREFAKIDLTAKSDFEAVAREADALIDEERYEEARSFLAGKIGEFRGTRHSFEIRQKIELLEVMGRPEVVEAEAVERVVDRREEFLRSAETAESLVRSRRYGEAVRVLEEAAAAAPFEDLKAEFTARAAELEDYAELFREMRDQIAAHPERFRRVDLGNGFRANAVAASDTELTVEIRGAESRLPFARMAGSRIVGILERLRLDAPGRLRLARFALEAGEAAVGHEAITAAVKADASLEPKAFALLARVRGIEVPDGGFVLYGDRWMTPTERDAAVLADRIADAEKRARSPDERKREEGLAELRELGAPAEKALVRALEWQREAAVAELIDLPALKGSSTKAALHAEIEKRRKAALTLIFDTEKYPYPYGPNQNVVQAEVDGLVERVAVIWERPIAWLMERSENVRDLYSRAEEYSLELAALGHDPEVSFEDLVARLNEAVSIRRFAPSGTAKSALEWNDQVLEYNRLVDMGLDDEERACVLAVNEYRMMMGRRCVKWNEELLKAARGHSKHMSDHGYFAHDVPARFQGPEHDAVRTPQKRAQRAGYGGGVSENIARGSQTGRGSFLQWKGSSGHHRNLLGRGHTEVGVGRHGDWWTQNFGRASKKVELPAGARRREDRSN